MKPYYVQRKKRVETMSGTTYETERVLVGGTEQLDGSVSGYDGQRYVASELEIR